MNEAFGSTFMFKIFIVFLVFYIVFMTIAVSYAKVFRIKNRVIDILEFEQYSDVKKDNDVNEKVNDYLVSVNYHYNMPKSKCNSSDSARIEQGACIEANGDNGSYKVTLYLVITFPLFNYDFVIPVTGKTRSYS